MVKSNGILSLFMLLCFIGTTKSVLGDTINSSNWEHVGAMGLVVGYFGFGMMLESCLMNEQNKQLNKIVEEKAIQDWLEENNLNQFGESKDAEYEDLNNGPLKKNQSRFDYIKAKFNDEELIKPWKNGYRKILHKLKSIDRLSIRTGVASWSLMVASIGFFWFCECMHNYQKN